MVLNQLSHELDRVLWMNLETDLDCGLADQSDDYIYWKMHDETAVTLEDRLRGQLRDPLEDGLESEIFPDLPW